MATRMKRHRRKKHTKRRSKRGGEIDSNLRDKIEKTIKKLSSMNSTQLSDIISEITVAQNKLLEDLDKENIYIQDRQWFNRPLRPDSRKRLSDSEKKAMLLKKDIKYLGNYKNFFWAKEERRRQEEDAERRRLLEEERGEAYAVQQQQERIEIQKREKHINDWFYKTGSIVDAEVKNAQVNGKTEQELFDVRDTLLKNLLVEEPYLEHKQDIKKMLIAANQRQKQLDADKLIDDEERAADKTAAEKAAAEKEEMEAALNTALREARWTFTSKAQTDIEQALSNAEKAGVAKNVLTNARAKFSQLKKDEKERVEKDAQDQIYANYDTARLGSIRNSGGKKRKAKKSKKKRKRSRRTLKKRK